jgi:hypothetical protein
VALIVSLITAGVLSRKKSDSGDAMVPERVRL